MLGGCDWVVEQEKKLCPDAIISVEMLDPFQYSLGVIYEGDPITSALGDSTRLFLFHVFFLFYAMLSKVFSGCKHIEWLTIYFYLDDSSVIHLRALHSSLLNLSHCL